MPNSAVEAHFAAAGGGGMLPLRAGDLQEFVERSWDRPQPKVEDVSEDARGTAEKLSLEEREQLAIEAAKRHSRRAFRSTEEWERIDKLARCLHRWLRSALWSDSAPKTPAGVEVCANHAEYFVAFHLAVGVRDMLTRLVAGFVMVVAGLTMLLSAHLFYSFQGRPMWLALDWAAIGISSIVAVAILVGLEKNSLLSRLWNTESGKINWASGLSWKMAVFAVVTLLSIFAALFPEVGGNLASWLEPVRKTLP